MAPACAVLAGGLRCAGRHRIEAISLSLTHDRLRAAAVARQADAHRVPLSGWLLYHLLPYRRKVVRENLRRVFGETISEQEITRLAQAHYAHIWRLIVEFLWFPLLPIAQRQAGADRE
jgi:hypothetical protein